MARKKKEEAQKTRQQLIEAAIGLFATRGVANTTLTDIADAAQLTRGAVYWHFSSKAEIFNAIWEQQLPLREMIRDRLILSEKDDPLLMLRERLLSRCNILRASHASMLFYKFCIISVNFMTM